MIGFGKFGKRNYYEIKNLEDACLLKIDTSKKDFYDVVLNLTVVDDEIAQFIEAIEEVKEAEIGKFWIPVYAPALQGNEIVFMEGKRPAIGHSFGWWEKKVKEMPTIEEKHWEVGSEYQYYAFLVYLINSLINNGWKPKKAIEAIVFDSSKLGHFCNSENAKENKFEPTGSRKVCGVFDLANTAKFLSCTNKESGGYWLATGDYTDTGNCFPLAELRHFDKVCTGDYNSVGWLVLE